MQEYDGLAENLINGEEAFIPKHKAKEFRELIAPDLGSIKMMGCKIVEYFNPETLNVEFSREILTEDEVKQELNLAINSYIQANPSKTIEEKLNKLEEAYREIIEKIKSEW